MAKFKSKKLNRRASQKLEINFTDFFPEHDLSRIIEELVWELDTSEIESTYKDSGQRAFHPKLMLSILFYGYSQGVRSSRKLSEACQTDIRYIYLSGGLQPKKSAISDFRKDHHKSFKDLFIQVIEQCKKMGLIEQGETVYGDGTKIRANASKSRTKTKSTYERWIKHLEEDVAQIEEELSKIQSTDSLAKQQDLAQQLKTKKDFKKK